MKILVFGATGPTGQEIVKQGLELGHDLTAFVRNPERLIVHHPGLSFIVGDAVDERAVADAIEGHDAVLSALGTGKSPKGDIFSVGLKNIISGMQKHNLKRLVVMSAHGVGDSFYELSWPLRIGVRTVLRPVFRDKERGEVYLQQSGLDWTCIHPVILTNGPKTGTGAYRTGEHIPLRMIPRISRADVADFMLSIVGDGASFHKRIVISN